MLAMDIQDTKPAAPFRFLDLAPELRQKVYTIIASSPSSPINLSSTFESPHKHFPHALLLTCTQIYHELRPLYFTVNTFSVTVFRRNETWDHLLSPAFLDNRRQIRSLRIIIVRWGAKDFFTSRLIPALEDCILNGRLRELEVVIRDGSLGKVSMLHGLHEGGKENEHWRKLGRLLRDPYLEKVTLRAGKVQLSAKEGRKNIWDWDLEKCEDVTWMLKGPGLD